MYEPIRVDATQAAIIREHARVRLKLAAAREMLQDFRANTSLGTIISEYEARVKEMEG